MKYPDHPFAKRIENLAEDKQIKVKYRRKEHGYKIWPDEMINKCLRDFLTGLRSW
jgi:hypothetical protein